MIKCAVLHGWSTTSGAYYGLLQLLDLMKVFGFRFDVLTSLTKAQLNSDYDCAIVFEYKKATDSGSLLGSALVPYTSGDKPVFFINGQNRSLASDFPIIPFVQADTSTYYQHESGLFSTEDMKYVGTCVIDKYGKTLWGTFANYVYPSTPTDYAFYRVDTTKLDENREILVKLEHNRMGIAEPPANHAVVVRYYNRYFLPNIGYECRLFSVANGWSFKSRINGLPLLLYAMSHAGIKPDNKLTVYHEIDHPLGIAGYSGYTTEQKLTNLYKTLTWLIDSFKHKGLNIVCGITTNHTRDNTWGHVYLYNNYDLGKRINNLLRDNPSLFSTCWHDHSYDLGTVGLSYTRHAGGSYGTPNNITDSDCNFGTGSSATMNLRSRVPLLVHIEDQKRWMVDYLGFSGIWAEPFYHINCATNSYGGANVLLLLRKLFGLKSVRYVANSSTLTTGQGTNYNNISYGTNPQKIEINGVDMIPTDDLMPSSITSFAGINTFFNLNATGDNKKIYRRYMAKQLNMAFNLYLMLGTCYFHESAILEASLSDPLSRFYNTGNFNGWVELFSEIDNMINFIPDWMRWGTVEDVRELRSKVK